MLARRLWDPQGNYHGTYGAATKADLYDITAHPLDQRFFTTEASWHEVFKQGATSYITDQAKAEDMATQIKVEEKNPRHELPKDKPGLLAMDTIPYLVDQQINMATPMDYEAQSWARTFQMSEQNAQAQATLFTDPKAMENPSLVQEASGKQGAPAKGMSQLELYSMDGSAAGKISNYLYLDQDGAPLMSIENNVAF